MELLRLFDGILAIHRLSASPVGLGFQHLPQSFTDDRIVIDNENILKQAIVLTSYTEFVVPTHQRCYGVNRVLSKG